MFLCASWAWNPHPPKVGQNRHQMGRHKRSQGIRTGILRRISARNSPEGSRGPYLDFLFTIFGPQNPQKSQNPILNLHTWPQPWRAWKIKKCQFLKTVFSGKTEGPWGPRGPSMGPFMGPLGPQGPSDFPEKHFSKIDIFQIFRSTNSEQKVEIWTPGPL